MAKKFQSAQVKALIQSFLDCGGAPAHIDHLLSRANIRAQIVGEGPALSWLCSELQSKIEPAEFLVRTPQLRTVSLRNFLAGNLVFNYW